MGVQGLHETCSASYIAMGEIVHMQPSHHHHHHHHHHHAHNQHFKTYV